MRVTALYILFVSLAAFAWPTKERMNIFLAGDSTMSIKEPRAFPETGWGMPFVYFWDSSVAVVNRARNGRSTKTFISEGIWESIQKELKAGDHVFIQFGHNDESKEKKERYATPETFTMNLERMVMDCKARQAVPVLVTPVSRRRFDREGKVQQTHAEYSPLVRAVAAKHAVVLIDLDELSRELYQQFGPENSRLLFLQLKPGEHPNYPDGRDDNTHFNELGARLIAQIMLKEIRGKLPELARHIKSPATVK